MNVVLYGQVCIQQMTHFVMEAAHFGSAAEPCHTRWMGGWNTSATRLYIDWAGNLARHFRDLSIEACVKFSFNTPQKAYINWIIWQKDEEMAIMSAGNAGPNHQVLFWLTMEHRLLCNVDDPCTFISILSWDHKKWLYGLHTAFRPRSHGLDHRITSQLSQLGRN